MATRKKNIPDGTLHSDEELSKILDERAEGYLQHIEALNEMLNAPIVNDFYCIRHLGIPQIRDEAIKAYRRTEGEALKVIYMCPSCDSEHVSMWEDPESEDFIRCEDCGTLLRFIPR